MLTKNLSTLKMLETCGWTVLFCLTFDMILGVKSWTIMASILQFNVNSWHKPT